MKRFLFLGVLFFVGCQNIEPKVVHKKVEQNKTIKKNDISQIVKKEFLKRIDNLAIRNSNQKASLYRDTQGKFVIDPNKELMWQDDKSVIRDKYYQTQAQVRCDSLDFQNYKNWRLPNQEELVSIVDKKYYPAIKPIFKNISIGKYWSLEPKRYVDFTYGDIGDGNLEKGYTRCVRKSVVLKFLTKKNMCLYEAIKGNNDTFYVYRNQTGKFDRFIYFEYPFLEIEGFKNSLFNLWYSPRKLKKPTMKDFKIKKIDLPKPIQLVKSEYETNEMFQARKKRLENQRKQQISKLKQEYETILSQKKLQLQKELKKYYIQKAQIQKEQKYKDTIKKQKQKEFEKIAFDTLMGKMYLQKQYYDAEKGILYATLKSKRANYQTKLEIKVPVMDSLDFVNNIDKVKLSPTFKYQDRKIILTSLQVSLHSKTYPVKIVKQNYEINDRFRGLEYNTESIMNQKFEL